MSGKSKSTLQKKRGKYNWQFWAILAIPVIYAFVFAYIPMGGIILAFKNYSIRKGILGSPWVGLKYFKQFLTTTSSKTVIANTFILGIYSLLVNFPFPILFAVLVNELRSVKFKKTVQFVSYAPYFISTVVLVGMMMQMMDLRTGIFNKILAALGLQAVNFFGDPKCFRGLYVWSGLWQTMGYNSIIYIAALAGVSQELKDGANRLQRILHVDLPSILPTIVIMLIFSCSSIVNIGFDKVYLMQNSMNASVSEVISTYVYKVGLVNSDFGFSTAAGLFQSLVSFALLVIVPVCGKEADMEHIKFKYMSTGEKIFTIVDYLLLTFVLVVIAYPIIYIVSASFSSPEAVIAGKVVLWPVDVTLRGYKAVFSNPKIMIGFRNSIFYTVVGTLINIIMTMFCAFPLSRKEFTARNKLSAYFVFTMYFSGGLVPTYILVMKLGLINSPWAMIIPTAMSTYNMIIARTYMVNSIPDELYEATEIDGGTPWQYFIKIVWPLCKPIIAVLVLYYGVAKWNDYYNAMIFLKKDSLQPLTIVMRDILIQNQVDPTMLTDARQASELAGLTQLLKYSTIVVASLPVLIMYPFVQKYFVKGVMIGAVKG